MADIEDYSTTPASNTTDWAEGQAPSTVNDSGREMQADIAKYLTRMEGNCTVGGTANAITATFTVAHTAHRDKRIIVIRAGSTNTGATTFTLDALTAYAIVKDGGTALTGGEIQSNGTYFLQYDLANTQWELLNPSDIAFDNKGADIASATTTDIGAATGNFVDITGTTTITGLGTVKAGTKRTLQFDGSLTLTHNATSLILPTGADFVTTAGDVLDFISLGSGNWQCTNIMERHGTWTPYLQDATHSAEGAESETYFAQYGSYTKIGNRILIQGTLHVNSLGTLTTSEQAFVGGLPFTSSSTSSAIGTISSGFGSSLNITAGTYISGEIQPSTDYIELNVWSGATGAAALLISEVTTGGFIDFSGQYIV